MDGEQGELAPAGGDANDLAADERRLAVALAGARGPEGAQEGLEFAAIGVADLAANRLLVPAAEGDVMGGSLPKVVVQPSRSYKNEPRRRRARWTRGTTTR